MENIGVNIKNLRNERLLSQSELAEKSGISRTQISRIERGIEKNPTMRTLSAICGALGASIDGIRLVGYRADESFVIQALRSLSNDDRNEAIAVLREWLWLNGKI